MKREREKVVRVEMMIAANNMLTPHVTDTSTHPS